MKICKTMLIVIANDNLMLDLDFRNLLWPSNCDFNASYRDLILKLQPQLLR